MTTLDLQPIPNQSIQFQVDNETYSIKIRQIKNAMICDISRNEISIINGLICNPFTKLIPYEYLVTNGNFYFDTLDNELINYKNFGTSQFLYYVPIGELQ